MVSRSPTISHHLPPSHHIPRHDTISRDLPRCASAARSSICVQAFTPPSASSRRSTRCNLRLSPPRSPPHLAALHHVQAPPELALTSPRSPPDLTAISPRPRPLRRSSQRGEQGLGQRVDTSMLATTAGAKGLCGQLAAANMAAATPPLQPACRLPLAAPSHAPRTPLFSNLRCPPAWAPKPRLMPMESSTFGATREDFPRMLPGDDSDADGEPRLAPLVRSAACHPCPTTPPSSSTSSTSSTSSNNTTSPPPLPPPFPHVHHHHHLLLHLLLLLLHLLLLAGAPVPKPEGLAHPVVAPFDGYRTPRTAGCKGPPTPSDGSAPSASLDHLEAQAAPAHPRTQLGGSRRPRELASGRAKVEDSHLFCGPGGTA